MKRGGESGDNNESGHGVSGEEFSGPIKKQKSIKLNINQAQSISKGGNGAMMRKSSDLNDLNKDTFRG